jgi:hypothetical protein
MKCNDSSKMGGFQLPKVEQIRTSAVRRNKTLQSMNNRFLANRFCNTNAYAFTST